MSERNRIIFAVILLLILIGAIVYAFKQGQLANAPYTLTPSPEPEPYDTATVRASHSYRLEDNLSVPSERKPGE